MKPNGQISCKTLNAVGMGRLQNVPTITRRPPDRHRPTVDRHPPTVTPPKTVTPTVTLNLVQGPFNSLKLRSAWHDGC